MDHQTSILRKTPGINNLFHSNVRRSRSAASLQKGLPEDFKSQFSLASRQYNDGPQTGLRPPLKTAKTVGSPEGLRPPTRKWFANSSTNTPPQNPRTPSPPSRPKPAPRLWTEQDEMLNIKPSLVGFETVVAPRSRYNTGLPPRKPVASTGQAAGSSQYYYDNRTHPPLNYTSSPSHDTSVSRRRKPSVADLHLEVLSTVAEWSNESPTLRLGRAGRNHSDPSSNRESLTPRARSSDAGEKIYHEPATATAMTPTAHKRASSMLLPIALAPVITSSPPQIDSYQSMHSPEGDKPPVPPKSPRYKTSPNQRRPLFKQRSASSSGSGSSGGHSANSSFSELNFTLPSTATTMSPVELPCGWPGESSHSPPLSPKSLHHADLSIDPSGNLPWVMKEFRPPQNALPQPSPRAAQHDRSKSDIGSAPAEKPQSPHQRSPSDSVLNRGRPTKRSLHKTKRSISQEEKPLVSLSATLSELPEGHRRTQAFDVYSRDELLDMRYDAERTARKFEALSAQDVRNLNKELDLLGDLCAQLRRKTLSLRDSRRSLHDRLITFLKAPGNALVSREHVVKQDSELAELDNTIDEATTKLEAAQERRNKVQRKLLEHTAAVLAISVPSCGSCDQQTPPRSPVTDAPLDILIGMEASEAAAHSPDQFYQSTSPESYEAAIAKMQEQFPPDAQPESALESYETAAPENYDGSAYGSYGDSAPSSYSAGALIDAHTELDTITSHEATEEVDDDNLTDADLEREEREYEERIRREQAATEAHERQIQDQAEAQHAALEREVSLQQQQREEEEEEAVPAAAAAPEQPDPESTSAPSDAEDLPLLLSQARYKPPAAMQRSISQQSQQSQREQAEQVKPPQRSQTASPAKPNTVSPPASSKVSVLVSKYSTSPPTRKDSLPPKTPRKQPSQGKKAREQQQPTKPERKGTVDQPAEKTPKPRQKYSHLPKTPAPQTAPPQTQTQTQTQSSQRNELVQSIQVYADQGVYEMPRDGMESLLSSIEQEIDAMDRQRNMVFA